MQIIDNMSTSATIHVELTDEGREALAGKEAEAVKIAREFLDQTRPKAVYHIEITPYGFMFVEDNIGRNLSQSLGLRYSDVRLAMKYIKGRLDL